MRAKKKVMRAARQLFQVAVVDGRVDEGRVIRIARRLASSKRRAAWSLLSCFQRLVRLDRDRHAAVVESAVPLPDDLRDGLQADLALIYGSGLEASFKEDPALIGGVRIQVGSDVYDGSVRARLAALAARL
jgi:F-type H+-transporting ATPase subunit delta